MGTEAFAEVSSWRERLVNYCLTLAVIIGLVALVPSLIISVSVRATAILWLDVVAYTVVFILWVGKRLPYTLRAAGFVATCFSVGAGLLAALGPWGSGVAWTFAAIAFAALLLGRVGAVVTGGFVAIAAVVLGYLLHLGVLSWPIASGEWAVHMINLLASAAGLALATDFLVGRIESALVRQRHYHRVLRRNHARLRVRARKQDELLRELHHRVKNNLQLVVSLLNLEDEDNPNALAVYRSRVNCLALTHELVHGEGSDGTVPGGELLREVRDHLPERLCRVSAYTWCAVEDSEVSLDSETAGAIALLVNELLQAWLIAHGSEPTAGSCRLRISRAGSPGAGSSGSLTLIGETSGELGDAFLDRVYGSGGYLIEALVGQLRGSLSVQQAGSEVTVTVAVPRVTRSLPVPPEQIA